MISSSSCSATGEGFRRGNDQVLRELGQNIAIVWAVARACRRGERAGRVIHLTVDDARAIAARPRWWRSSAPNSSASCGQEQLKRRLARVVGVEPPYQKIRTIELEAGRLFSWTDEEQTSRVAIVGYDMADQLFGKRHILGRR